MIPGYVVITTETSIGSIRQVMAIDVLPPYLDILIENHVAFHIRPTYTGDEPNEISVRSIQGQYLRIR